MAVKKNRILQLALESQLDLLKRRLENPDAAQWRQLGKMTQDFDLWLERARPLIPCAARLISLRVNQISGTILPEVPAQRAARQLMDLLEEAGRHLANPGSPIQVIDLGKEERDFLIAGQCPADENLVGLPEEMFELPGWLQPQGEAAVPFRFIIPN